MERKSGVYLCEWCSEMGCVYALFGDREMDYVFLELEGRGM